MDLPFNFEVNGFVVRDSLGFVWDGIDRPAATWSVAQATCASVGARLPTVTELYRNIYGGSSSQNIMEYFGITSSDPLWTLIPQSPNVYYTVTLLSTTAAYLSSAAATSTSRFRCIWNANKAGFSNPQNCYTSCLSGNNWYIYDSTPRIPLTFMGAVAECGVYDASLPNLQLAYALGLTSSGYWVNEMFSIFSGIFYTHPGVVNGAIPNQAAFPALDSTVNPFFCVSRLASINSQTDACSGACVRMTSGLNKFLINSADLGPVSNVTRGVNLQTALSDCFSSSGTITSFEHLTSLSVNNINMVNPLWFTSIELSTTNAWQYLTLSPASPPTAIALTNPVNSTANYRCVWAEYVPLPSCPNSASNSINWFSGQFSCVTNTLANPTSAFTGLPVFQDVWGYSWDGADRTPANYSIASSVCQSFGARLPFPSEIYRVRQNGPFPISNFSASSSTLLTNRVGIGITLDSGAVNSSLFINSVFPYRCVWPPTNEGNIFSGSKCFGAPSSPCLLVGSHFLYDQYDRPVLSFSNAFTECQLLGGSLPTLNQYLRMVNANPPNGFGAYNWIVAEQAFYFTGLRYPLLGTWVLGGSSVTSNIWGTSSASQYLTQPFRCVFSSEF